MSAGISSILLAEGVSGPPPVTDPDYANVWLRAPFDALPFVDVSNSPLTITNTSVTLDTAAGATPKFIDAARLAASSGNFLDFGTAAGAKFLHDGSIKYSLEFWFNTSLTGSTGPIFRTSNGSTTGSGIYMEFNPSTRDVNVYMFRGVVSTLYLNANFPAALANTAGAWQWLLFTFDPTLGSNHAKLAVGGGTPQNASLAGGGNTPSAANPDRVLRMGDGAWHVDDVRITKNVIRANTLPTVAFPTS